MHVNAEGGHFDLILVEALDRLGRKLARRRIFTTVKHPGGELHAASAVEVIAMHVGMLGTYRPRCAGTERSNPARSANTSYADSLSAC